MATVCSGLLVFRTSWHIVWLQVCAVHRPAAPCVLAREIRNYITYYNKLPSQIWPGRRDPAACAVCGRPTCARAVPRRSWVAVCRVGVQLVRCVLLGPRALPGVDAGHFVEP